LLRRVAIVLTTRGNYAKMKSTMRAIRAHDGLSLLTIVGGGIIQDRFGDYRPIIECDGFQIDATIDFLVGDGATLASQTESAGRAVSLSGGAIGHLRPDVILIVADRWEALAVALAATTMNVPIAHLEGGEVSGSIDERLRHAITKLAHLHLPANRKAAARLIRMGENPERVVVIGTPSLDMLADINLGNIANLTEAPGGEGDVIDFSDDYVVVSQHPVVTEAADAERQMLETARAVTEAGLPIVWILPNMDAGGEGVTRAIAGLRNSKTRPPMRTYPSMRFEDYAILLSYARCLVGNSSSGIREGAFLGIPVVNIGTRQTGRERGRNVIDVGHDSNSIVNAIALQIAHGRYQSDTVYGAGRSGERIAAALAAMPLNLDKTITY
jgi:UDP-hydrolysing UDP-N-acetyl-D-glucosamine 2-epimerase